jgi:monoamine oxidase
MSKKRATLKKQQYSRRQFIKAAGATSLTAATAVPLQGAMAAADSAPKNGSNYDVIVIGGGFAGVTAARDLKKNGLNPLLLEARNRLGGRTFTSKFAGHKTDLGGTWVGWLQPHVWAEINRYGLALEETPGAAPERMAWMSNGKVTHDVDGSAWEMLDDGFQKMASAAYECFPQPFAPLTTNEWKKYDHRSQLDRLNELKLPREQHDIVDSLLSVNCHNNLSEGGMVDLLRWNAMGGMDTTRLFDNLSRYTFVDGTKALIDAMIEDANPDVLLSSPVWRVEQKPDGVVVTTEDDAVYTAKALIVTLPMNVLDDIEFDPPLSPTKIAAAKERHSGSGHKLFAHCDNEIEPHFLATAPSPHPFSILFGYHGGPGETTMCGFGPPGTIDTTNDAEVQARIRDFYPEVKVTAVVSYDWTLDPYSQGTWCWYKPNQFTKYFTALQEREGRAWFASADSANGWRGFIDGAIERGARTAHEVTDFLS